MKKFVVLTLFAFSFLAVGRTVNKSEGPLPNCGLPGADPCPWVR